MRRARWILGLALRWLGHRPLASGTALAAIALALAVLVVAGAVDVALRRAAMEGAIRYPLVVGSAGSSGVQLVLSTLFHVDKPTGTIPGSVLGRLQGDARVRAAYPIAVADSLDTFPIVGTSPELLSDLASAPVAGRLDLSQPDHAVLGWEVASRTGLAVGATFHGTHGPTGGEGAEVHAEHPYRVVGVLPRTSTPQDAAVYVPVQAVWAAHEHAEQGHAEEGHAEEGHAEEGHAVQGHAEQGHAEEGHAEEGHAEEGHAEEGHAEEGHADEGHADEGHADEGHADEGHADHGADRFHLGAGRLTAVLVKTSNPAATVALEREWSLAEGTQAVDTGRSVRRLMGYLDQGQRLVQAFAAFTLGLITLLIAVTLLMSLQARRRELALLRSLGVGRFTVAAVLVSEALALALGGAAAGLVVGHTAAWWSEALLLDGLGVRIEPFAVTELELQGLLLTVGAGLVLALVAAVSAYRVDLVEELARD